MCIRDSIIHCPIGKVSFGAEKLVENYNTLIGAIVRAKPAAAKGQYIRSCVTASTMGPGAVSYTHLDVYKRQLQRRLLPPHTDSGR